MKYLAILGTILAATAFVATVMFSTLATWTVDPDTATRLAQSAFGTGILSFMFAAGSVAPWVSVYDKRSAA